VHPPLLDEIDKSLACPANMINPFNTSITMNNPELEFLTDSRASVWRGGNIVNIVLSFKKG